ncbi:MAG: hypothetical protein ABSD85_14985 [Acidimicrobiales bacterium]|jgi:hypothetical protein
MTEPNTVHLLLSDTLYGEFASIPGNRRPPAWNYLYNAMSAIQKIRPTSHWLVVTKPNSPASVAAP